MFDSCLRHQNKSPRFARAWGFFFCSYSVSSRSALYLLALHRLLQSRLGAAYDPREQLGGALYFFLRGLDGEAAGMHVLKPPLALLDGLEALLGDCEKESKEVQP